MNIRSIISTAVALTVSAAASAQSFTVNLKSGESVTYSTADVESIDFSPESGQVVPAAPKIGDFYYSDGTWSTEINTSKTPVGIVFCVGAATDYRDRASFYTLKDGETPMEEIHGYVVALEDATAEIDEWDYPWWSPFVSGDPGAGCSTDITDFLGYTNTKSIIASATSAGLSLRERYPATYYAAVDYESTHPAPATSSGWFLPSAAQFKYIYDRVYFDLDGSGRSSVEQSFAMLGEDAATPLYNSGAEYWTSTEKVDSYGSSTWAYYFNFDKSSIKPGFIADYRKNAGMRVRSMLAF